MEIHDPSKSYGSIVTVAAATVSLLVAFGVPLSDEQTTAILGFIAVVGPVVTAFLISRKAWRPDNHLSAVAYARTLPPSTITKEEAQALELTSKDVDRLKEDADFLSEEDES